MMEAGGNGENAARRHGCLFAGEVPPLSADGIDFSLTREYHTVHNLSCGISNHGKAEIMKTAVFALSLCVTAFALTSCIGTAPVEPMKSPMGASWRAPLNTNLKDLTFGTKVGRATVRCYLFGLYANGDMSVKTAADNAGIKTVRHVDYEYKNVFFFSYQEITTIAYGD
jgi:hypothetical protein